MSTLAFVGHSALLSGLYALEAVASLVIDMALISAFGLSAHADALIAAWALPQTLGRSVFQSLTKSFLGIFGGETGSRRTYGTAILATATLAVPAALLLSATTTVWLPLTIPGASASTRSMGASLAQSLSWLVASLAVTETVRAVYYAEALWGLPSLARLVGDVAAVGAIWQAGRMDRPGVAAWGLVLGASVEAAVALVGLPWTLGSRLRWRWPSPSEWREMLGMVVAPLVGQGARTLAGTVERAVASLVGTGALAAVSLAARIIHSLERFVLNSVVITTIRENPTNSASLRRTWRVVTWLGMWVAVVIGVLGLPLVRVLFMRGRFSSADANTLASVLRAYAPAIVALAATRVPFALGYARRRPGVILGYFFTVALGMSASLILLVRAGFGMASFGLSQAMGVWAAFTWLYLTLIRCSGQTLWTRRDLLQWLVAAVVVVGGTWAARSGLEGLLDSSPGGQWATVIGSVVVSGCLWLGSALALKVDEAIAVADWIKRRAQR